MSADLDVLFLVIAAALGGAAFFFIGYNARKLKAGRKIALAEDKAKKAEMYAQRDDATKRILLSNVGESHSMHRILLGASNLPFIEINSLPDSPNNPRPTIPLGAG